MRIIKAPKGPFCYTLQCVCHTIILTITRIKTVWKRCTAEKTNPAKSILHIDNALVFGAAIWDDVIFVLQCSLSPFCVSFVFRLVPLMFAK